MSDPANAIKRQRSVCLVDGKYMEESLEQTEAKVLAEHPGVLIYRVDITFPRCDRFVLWASPADISDAAFQQECKKIRDETFDRLCEY